MAKFELEAKELDKLIQTMEEFGEGSGRIIDEVLHGEGAKAIKEKIAPLIPRSGRSWSGKRGAAASAMPGAFKQDNGKLSVTVAARGAYGYLYFPDDGSNTRRHAGNQQFMKRGAEAAMPDVIEKCLGKLTEDF